MKHQIEIFKNERLIASRIGWTRKKRGISKAAALNICLQVQDKVAVQQGKLKGILHHQNIKM